MTLVKSSPVFEKKFTVQFLKYSQSQKFPRSPFKIYISLKVILIEKMANQIERIGDIAEAIEPYKLFRMFSLIHEFDGNEIGLGAFTNS